MLSSSLDTLLKVSKTTSPQKLFAYDCVTLFSIFCSWLKKNVIFSNHLKKKQNYKILNIIIGLFCPFVRNIVFTVGSYIQIST